MYQIVKTILFKFDPENIHYFVTNWLKRLHKIKPFSKAIKAFYSVENKNLETNLLGLHFKNPVGLAAGFDKNGDYIEELANFGFGFIEVGTVTPLPQAGNPKPRMFRLKADDALINRMGFNNDGVVALAKKLATIKRNGLIIGGNIGKNKDTPNENAVNDYVICFNTLFNVVDYFVVNVSSPNTPNLRALQEKEPLKHILNTLQNLNLKNQAPKPILLKIGVSGKPLTQKSTEVIKYLSQKSNHSFPIIGVGGINNANDAIEKLNAGASLVQIYTGFVYQGPGLVKQILRVLARR
ncbi:MAG: quinone-dependent dihydroorotate dehydrogenase [Sphingobacteriales bacterium]|nr:MAG: quinone-dependent dihydroorotate dehydrogenase [Sphingobacteriales bacterium]